MTGIPQPMMAAAHANTQVINPMTTQGIQPFMVYHPHSYAPQLSPAHLNMQHHMNLPQNQTASKFQPPPAKRPKLSHGTLGSNQNKTMAIKQQQQQPKPNVIEKTEEEKENEKIERLKLPIKLISGKNLTKWLDERLNILKEAESLSKKLIKDKKKLEIQKKMYRNVRTDIDVMKSMILQNNTGGIGDNKDLKKIFYRMSKIEDYLPTLREQHIIPMIKFDVKKFEKCDIRQIVNAQNEIKKILNDNEFKEKRGRFVMFMVRNIYNVNYFRVNVMRH